MVITAIVESQSQGDEIVLVTDPPLNEAIILDFNARLTAQYPDLGLQERGGKLVVSEAQMVMLQGILHGQQLAPILSRQLSEAEQRVNNTAIREEQQRRAKVSSRSHVFGVHLI